ncbi:transporter substrate-binding domain-containing protein [Legionella cardiaca]|uniref:Transporter substrate-binding domain-containing protein n=1 Tax=Legionella cardiaca TaxID=1071983 RepID=A0ABY8ANC1_9GAMM|nr:transporter substrate-binding domain-containing protein [Legionella cardiaca]WED41954.1 transporter substrate-binding domain-containing protein [Legionella cardiaca]
MTKNNLPLTVIIKSCKDTFYKLFTKSSFNDKNQIIPYNSTPDLLSALAQNKIDVIVLNNAIAHNIVKDILYNFKIVGPSLLLGDGYGIIALPANSEMITKINKSILSIQKDGTYTSIYQKYYNPF